MNNFVDIYPTLKTLTSLDNSFNTLSSVSLFHTFIVPNKNFFYKIKWRSSDIKIYIRHALTTGVRIVKIFNPDEVITKWDWRLNEEIAVIGPINTSGISTSEHKIQEEITLTDTQAYYFIVYHGGGYKANIRLLYHKSEFGINNIRFS